MSKFFKSKRQKYFYFLIQLPLWFLVILLPSECYHKKEVPVFKEPQVGTYTLFGINYDEEIPIGNIEIEKNMEELKINIHGKEAEFLDILENKYTYNEINIEDITLTRKLLKSNEEIWLGELNGIYFIVVNLQDDCFYCIPNENIKYLKDIYIVGVVTKTRYSAILKRQELGQLNMQDSLIYAEDENKYLAYFYQDKVK